MGLKVVLIAVVCLTAAACSHSENASSNATASADAPSGWYWDGADDNYRNFPTAKYCSTSASSRDAFSTDPTATRVCIDYVAGLKKVILPQVSYRDDNEYKTTTLKGVTADLPVSVMVEGLGRGGLHTSYLSAPAADKIAAFFKRQGRVTVFGKQIDVAGTPWNDKKPYVEPANVKP